MSIKPGMMPVVFAIWLCLAGTMGLLIAGAVLVVRDTKRGSGNWGINTKGLICPRCHISAPPVRVPRNRTQALWGGFTCACGCEVDKWGKEIPTAP